MTYMLWIINATPTSRNNTAASERRQHLFRTNYLFSSETNALCSLELTSAFKINWNRKQKIHRSFQSHPLGISMQKARGAFWFTLKHTGSPLKPHLYTSISLTKKTLFILCVPEVFIQARTEPLSISHHTLARPRFIFYFPPHLS